ncbi:MAG: discoidin domain-containing protein [Tannerella sp.]|jgi:hypothetical protein|nr:discoidin domain-containing protein [Tannerella sp.]
MKLYKTFACMTLCAIAGFFSCDSMHDLHIGYLESGERVYAAKVDSVSPGPGNKRIEMEVFIKAQRIDFIRFFWNAQHDSLDLGINNRTGVFKVMIENLEESDYLFEVVGFDKFGNRSLPFEVSSLAYGENYQRYLTNRRISSITYNADSEVVIEWLGLTEDAIYTTLYYTAGNGNEQVIVTPASESVTVVPDFSITEFRYVTSYRPAANSPDTFDSEETTGVFPPFERLFDKSKFAALSVEGDTPSAYDWVVSNLFDGDLNSGFHSPENLTAPGWITLDMGVVGKISRIKTWQRRGDSYDFGHYNPKRFEIWGTNDEANLANWNVWTKLMDCVSVKPSQAGGTTSDDNAVLSAGEEFACPPEATAVRYLRMKVLENWVGSYNFHFMEIAVYGDDR